MTVVPLRTRPSAELERAVAEDSRSMVGRISMILGAFQPGERRIGISEISRRIGLPKSTVARIVNELVEYRMLERDGKGVRFGIRMFELGESASRPHNLKRIALASMADLRSTVNLTVHLAVLERTDVVYLEVLRTRETPPLPSRVGGRMSAYATAVGKVLLAWSPESIVDELLSRPLVQVGPRTITDATELRHELERVRSAGVALDQEESRAGITCVAAAVTGSDGLPVAAISATGWTKDVDVEQVALAVRAAGLRLSRTVTKYPRLVG